VDTTGDLCFTKPHYQWPPGSVDFDLLLVTSILTNQEAVLRRFGSNYLRLFYATGRLRKPDQANRGFTALRFEELATHCQLFLGNISLTAEKMTGMTQEVIENRLSMIIFDIHQ